MEYWHHLLFLFLLLNSIMGSAIQGQLQKYMFIRYCTLELVILQWMENCNPFLEAIEVVTLTFPLLSVDPQYCCIDKLIHRFT